MSAPLARAILAIYKREEDKRTGKEHRSFLDEIWLDFNPESLQIVYPASAETSGARGCSREQVTQRSPATLSFSAIFDSTRPPALGAGGLSLSLSAGLGGGGPDVREKTKLLKALLGRDPARNPNAGYQYVQFRWGTILFNGLLQGFTETLDLFAADGTPLRARMSLSIVEHEAEREEEPEGRVAWSKRKSIGSLPNLGIPAGLPLGLSAGMSLGFSAGAGIGLSAGASLGVFGGAAVSAAFGARVDLSLGVSGLTATGGASTGQRGGTPTPWAPDGPTAGSAASADAAQVIQARAEGRSAPDPADALLISTPTAGGAAASSASGAPSLRAASPEAAATGAASSGLVQSGTRPAVEPLPIAGSPPLRLPPVPGAAPRPIYAAPALERAPAGRPLGRPSWEQVRAPDAATSGCKGRGRW